MFAPKAILFDMDDTLFDEIEYVKSGFWAVAAHLQQARDLPADYSYPSMMAFFELEGRGAIFDRVIERFEVRRAEGLVAECIAIYRNHQPTVQPYRGVRQLLASISNDYKTALVTNGLPIMQERKLTALDVGQYFDAVVYCEETGKPKPDPAGLITALSLLDVAAADAVMVGDNPTTDGAAARAASIPFLRVRTSRFADLANTPDTIAELSSVLQLPTFLADKDHVK